MPRRGNRKANLSERLANIQPRGIVPPGEIPGSQAWSCLRDLDSLAVKYDAQKAQESFFANYSVEELAAYAKTNSAHCSNGLESNNETLIDGINRWVDGNGWQYIDGGEYDGSWVNPRYPNRIFVGTSRTLPIRGGDSEQLNFQFQTMTKIPLASLVILKYLMPEQDPIYFRISGQITIQRARVVCRQKPMLVLYVVYSDGMNIKRRQNQRPNETPICYSGFESKILE